jgi:hypothetical protein
MVYTKTTWASTTRISAEALNHLESQYDEVLASSSTWNNHDSRYYPKATALTKFYNPSYMGNGSGADADLIDGHQASELIGTGLPVGSVIWWAEDSGDVPTGWYVCDGATHGAYTLPDYRNRFVIGVSGSYTLGNYYGAATVTPTSYSVTIGGTVLDTTQIASHHHVWTETHGYPIVSYGYNSYGYNGTFVYANGSSTAPRTTDAAGSGGSHTHTGSSVTYNSEDNIPPFYALYLIKRVV